jgi:mRNA interferase YafQ
MQYAIKYTNRFRKDVKKAKKRGYDIALLEEAIEILQAEGCLPSRYKPHTSCQENMQENGNAI